MPEQFCTPLAGCPSCLTPILCHQNPTKNLNMRCKEQEPTVYYSRGAGAFFLVFSSHIPICKYAETRQRTELVSTARYYKCRGDVTALPKSKKPDNDDGLTSASQINHPGPMPSIKLPSPTCLACSFPYFLVLSFPFSWLVHDPGGSLPSFWDTLPFVLLDHTQLFFSFSSHLSMWVVHPFFCYSLAPHTRHFLLHPNEEGKVDRDI